MSRSVDPRVAAVSDRTRFEWAMPRLSRLLAHPSPVMALLAILALGLAVISKHLAIGVAALGCFYWCLRMERRHLDRLAVPPLVLFGFSHLLSSGFGLPLIWLGVSLHGISREGEVHAMWLVQLAHAIAFPALMMGYYCTRAGSPPFCVGTNATAENQSRRLLSHVGWFMLVYFLISTAAGILTGSTDRSRVNEFVERGFGIWSWFNLFPRFNHLLFILLPLMFARARNVGRAVIIVGIGVALSFKFLSGSRSAVLMPICFLFIGWWMFWPHSRRAIRYAMLAVFLAIPYIVVVPFYRSTTAFAEAKQLDWWARFAAFDDMLKVLRGTGLGSTLQVAGESLHGVNDREIFLQTPETIPHASWQDCERLKMFWLPSLFAPNKKSLLDGNEIVQFYRGDPTIYGAGISFTADMFRRFGWGGIWVGSFVLGAFLGAIYRRTFQMQRERYATYATLFILLSLTFFVSTPYRTLLETAWIWLWEIPKYLVVLISLVAIDRYILRSNRTSHSGQISDRKFPRKPPLPLQSAP